MCTGCVSFCNLGINSVFNNIRLGESSMDPPVDVQNLCMYVSSSDRLHLQCFIAMWALHVNEMS